jgi:hypothetical protein
MSYEWLDARKCCHAKLYEKADPLKALGSVASFLRNRIFTLINDMNGHVSFFPIDGMALDVLDDHFQVPPQLALPCALNCRLGRVLAERVVQAVYEFYRAISDSVQGIIDELAMPRSHICNHGCPFLGMDTVPFLAAYHVESKSSRAWRLTIGFPHFLQRQWNSCLNHLTISPGYNIFLPGRYYVLMS